MFFQWVITSFVFLISIITEIIFFKHIYISALFNLLFSFLLELGAAAMLIKKINEPEKVDFSFKAFWIWSAYISLFLILLNYRGIILRNELLEYRIMMLFGAFLFTTYYASRYIAQNKVHLIYQKPKDFPQEDRFSTYSDLLISINHILYSKTILKQSFREDLEELKSYVFESKEKCIDLNVALLKELNGIYSSYYTLLNERIKTDEIEKTLENIENLTIEVKESIKNRYEEKIKIRLLDLNSRVSAVSDLIRIKKLEN